MGVVRGEEMGDGVGDKREFIDIARRTVPCSDLAVASAGSSHIHTAHSRSLASEILWAKA